MPQFRVFISHSARDDDHATKLLNELRAGLEAVKDAEGNQKFGVLIDKDDLELGVLGVRLSIPGSAAATLP